MLAVHNLSLNVGRFKLKDINLVVQEGEFFALLGPTGAGKSVFLEALAGLRQVNSGNIWLNGQDITFEKPEKRKMAFVYQDFSLFPHKKVKDNIRYGLYFQKQKNKDREEKFYRYLVELLNIENLLERYPESLSGGEKQKVALARALMVRPATLLLDEPFSSLDFNTREELVNKLQSLHRDLANRVILVTHDFTEARILANRAGVIREGFLEQAGSLEEIFLKPASYFVAEFTGMKNLFPVTVSEGKAWFSEHAQAVVIEGKAKEGNYYLGVRPENILLAKDCIERIGNCFSGIITGIKNKGVYLEVNITTPFAHWKAVLSPSQFSALDLKLEEKVYFGFNPSQVILVDH